MHTVFRHFRALHPVVVVALVLFGFSQTGCRRRTDPDTQFREGKQIASIAFFGNSALSDEQLKKYLPVQKKDYFLEGSESAVFDILLQAYAAHGYYHAVLESVEVTETRRNRLDIKVHLLEREPTLVRSVRFEWKGATPHRSIIARALPLQEGGIADIEQLNKAVETLNDRLADLGYALAEVHESMVVTRDEHAADVVFHIDAGPICRVREIHITGLEFAPSNLVYAELEEFKGKVYTPRVKSDIEENLGELNAFRMVTIEPVPAPNRSGQIDLDVSVIEADFQTLKLGVGVQFETNKFLGWTSAVYQHNNFLHRLNQFQLRARLGWALVPAFWNVEDMGPVTLIEPGITKKGLLERRLRWNWTMALQTDVEENYKLFSPSNRLSVSRTFFKHLNIRLAYNIEYIVLYGIDDYVMEELQRQHEDMRSPIRLADLNVGTRLWFADRQNDPDNGVVFRFDYWHSGPYLASEVRFNKIRPAVTGYWRMLPFLQLVLHGEVGYIYPLGSKVYTGIRSNFFLGGHNTVRGWGGKRLAPWVRICEDTTALAKGVEPKCEKIWIGGRTMVQANAELRFRWNKVVSSVLFVDMGDVQYAVRTIKPGQWNYSAGTGIRISTPVGKIRFDMGIRLNEPEAYRAERRFGIHLGLGEAF
ncbi:MAG: BamA/TamA family outer membrane protein [Deltaproteobacteria bacterium]|nr:BamA/TamA family outer membrane protein [Deltaproteobacteria bacterium]